MVPVKLVFARLSSSLPAIAGNNKGKIPVTEKKGVILAGSSEVSKFKSANNAGPSLFKPSPSEHLCCPRCLQLGHLEAECTNRVRCAACSKLDHRAAVCWSKSKKKVWVQKSKSSSGPSTALVPVAQKSSQPMFAKTVSIIPKAAQGRDNLLIGSVPLTCLDNRQFPSASSSSPALSLNPICTVHQASMANVNVDPTPFVPPAMGINAAWLHRLPRDDLIITDDPPKRHEGIAVAVLEPPPPPKQYEHFLHIVVEYVQNTLGFHVLDTSRHASEFAYVHIASPVLRDALVLGGPYVVNEQFVLRFVNHDNTSTCQNSPPVRESWVMFLDFPLDLQTDSIVDKAVGTFGRLLHWSNGPRFRGRVLAKAILSMVEEVPSKIVIKKYTSFGGVGRSWTILVFVLNGDFADVQPIDEDLPPVNHIPIPDPPPVVQQNVVWENVDEEMGENNNEEEEVQEDHSRDASAISQQEPGDWQIIPHFQSTAPLISAFSVSEGSVVCLTQELPTVMPSFMVFPQFWKLINICKLILDGQRPSSSSGPPVSNALTPFQLPAHQIIQFALLAGALIWAKENWASQQVISVQPIRAISPHEDVDFELPSDPFLQVVSPQLPPRPSRNRKSTKVVLVDSERRSARINKITGGYMSPDPNQGVGKPRGKTKAKSSKKLKMLAEESVTSAAWN
ncbi:uncharacterized protein LOC127752454 isoform X2 [Oryza glaberrima]|uniref:uncharacterized protein LOC127752454 isoform X2 n=1 Tax=Oryza glaberrima TaxID=4538 RepID=UPI00224BFA36|nr:uncharacterized protein LOC127752454 isoform X2 [Oryza glaberrima]